MRSSLCILVPTGYVPMGPCGHTAYCKLLAVVPGQLVSNKASTLLALLLNISNMYDYIILLILNIKAAVCEILIN